MSNSARLFDKKSRASIYFEAFQIIKLYISLNRLCASEELQIFCKYLYVFGYLSMQIFI